MKNGTIQIKSEFFEVKKVSEFEYLLTLTPNPLLTYRAIAHLRQYEAALKFGVSPQSWNYYEHGRRVPKHLLDRVNQEILKF